MLSYRSIKNLPARRLTRLAPTPSGFLHLGNILSFAITCHFAAKTGARILLRIDDLDRERSQDEFVEDIFSSLRFLDIPWQLGPQDPADFNKNWSQKTRLKLYEESLQELQKASLLFGCECTRSQLANSRSETGSSLKGYPGTCLKKHLPLQQDQLQWRLATRPAKLLSVNRLGGGEIKGTLPEQMAFFAVRRKDGVPAYQLASLVDDHYFGVDLIVRGVDLWPSTWAQVYLSSLLDSKPLQQVQFVHHPLLTEKGGEKMSKSEGATSIQSLRKSGATAADVYTEIARCLGSLRPCHNWTDLALLAEKTFAP
ncbi:MAG: glutamate--tRNA ligase family protein [Chitinophagaceae bacterium]